MKQGAHINQLEIENTKRVRAVTITPAETGLTVIGGNNNQGKTSVLDAIAWALGGERFRPDNPMREGANTPPRLRVTLSNGCVVERSGKNATLKVTDPTGKRAGQQLLNSFVEELALNLPKFMQASDKEKADPLLRISGVGAQLVTMDRQEAEAYNKRRYIGQQYQQKRKYADELPEVKGAPAQEVSALELIQRQQEILWRNEENRRKRENLSQLKAEQRSLAEQLDMLREQYERVSSDIVAAEQATVGLVDESTTQLEADLQRIDQINQQVRTNQAKANAMQAAEALDAEYRALTEEIGSIRRQRTELLTQADLPLPGLSVENGKLLYHDQPWGNMSGSDQLRVATAIVRRLNPNCAFVLLDKLEQMDLATLREFGVWLEQEGLQAIATRVSTGGECSIIIEDGLVKAPEPEFAPPAQQWQKGVF